MTNVTQLPVRLKDTGTIVQVVHDYSGCQHRRAIVDAKLAELSCADCGVKINPIQFLVTIAAEERMLGVRERGIALARAALEARSKCRCTKCGEWTEIRRVTDREIKALKAKHA